MAERAARVSAAPAQPATADAPALEADESERLIGRIVRVALPVAGLAGAVLAGVFASFGTALLVLAATVLIGAIALLWASMRTLSGDAPLPADFEGLGARSRVDALSEEKARVLRALKDIEGEHELGKIEDADYEAVVARYRAEAKAVMREMDRLASPAREEAELVAEEYLRRRGLSGSAAAASTGAESDRRVCGACHASNETDAAFCKACGASMKRDPEADATA